VGHCPRLGRQLCVSFWWSSFWELVFGDTFCGF
jgi:hypothetical protein